MKTMKQETSILVDSLMDVIINSSAEHLSLKYPVLCCKFG